MVKVDHANEFVLFLNVQLYQLYNFRQRRGRIRPDKIRDPRRVGIVRPIAGLITYKAVHFFVVFLFIISLV